MANWASTSYYIEGQQCDLREIFNLCKDFMDCKRQPMKETADNEWEGNVIMALGMDVEKYYLRGFIQACELDGDVLRIDAEEAWSLTDFKNALESHYDGLKVYFFVEEPGMEVWIWRSWRLGRQQRLELKQDARWQLQLRDKRQI